MTGPEHYREAERLLAEAFDDSETASAKEILAEAQVHATLALAAATALNVASGSAMPDPDWLAWRDAASMTRAIPGGES